LHVGDVITYQIPVNGRPVETHRVVRILQHGREPIVQTKGDGNRAVDPWTAKLHGGTLWRYRLRLPLLGYPILALRTAVAHKGLVYLIPGLLALYFIGRVWRRPGWVSSATIRKVNSREAPNDLGASRAALDRRLLRRGLPYGRRLEDPAGPDPERGNRGLLFVSYQSSIADQFEFLCTSWMGSPTNPRSPSGFDMLVGQNGHPGQGRKRHCVVFGKDLAAGTVSTFADYVVPTGGGYFFSPSITAMRETLAASCPTHGRCERG
jgi:hypothetical protein